jgi:hypothetical protein
MQLSVFARRAAPIWEAQRLGFSRHCRTNLASRLSFAGFAPQPLGDLGVQHEVKPYIRLRELVPGAVAIAKLDVILFDPVFVESATGKV